MMSRDIWVVSDTHFGHTNIIKYCNRPFGNIHEMNQCMVDNWNSTVKDGDLVYHLGDVYMSTLEFSGNEAWYLLSRLKGRKRLVLGNHDEGKDNVLLKHFQKIVAWRHFKEFGLLLTHVPVHPGTLNDKTPINVHGHIHQNIVRNGNVSDKRYKNVSVEHTNYTPVNIDDLRVR